MNPFCSLSFLGDLEYIFPWARRSCKRNRFSVSENKFSFSFIFFSMRARENSWHTITLPRRAVYARANAPPDTLPVDKTHSPQSPHGCTRVDMSRFSVRDNNVNINDRRPVSSRSFSFVRSLSSRAVLVSLSFSLTPLQWFQVRCAHVRAMLARLYYLSLRTRRHVGAQVFCEPCRKPGGGEGEKEREVEEKEG